MRWSVTRPAGIVGSYPLRSGRPSRSRLWVAASRLQFALLKVTQGGSHTCIALSRAAERRPGIRDDAAGRGDRTAYSVCDVLASGAPMRGNSLLIRRSPHVAYFVGLCHTATCSGG